MAFGIDIALWPLEGDIPGLLVQTGIQLPLLPSNYLISEHFMASTAFDTLTNVA